MTFVMREGSTTATRTAAYTGIAGACAVALLALLGWMTGVAWLTRFGVGSASMSVATALGALAGAAGVYLLIRCPHPGRAAAVVGAIPLAVGTIVLLRYLAGDAEGGSVPGMELGSVSFATALCMVLLGAGILAAAMARPLAAATSATIGLVLAGIDLVGHAYGLESLYRVAPFATMALPTALAFAMLFIAQLLARPRDGWIGYAIHRGQAGTAFRLLMPAVLVVPIGFGGLVTVAVNQGHFDPVFARVILSAAMTLVLGAFVCAAAAWLGRIETMSDRLAEIVEASDDAIIGETLDGVVTSWNRGAERLFGYSAADAVGRNMLFITPEERHSEQDDLRARIRRGEHVSQFESVRQRRDGSLVDVSISLSPARDASGLIVGASSIKRDITALKLRDAELERSNAELEQFAYVASHDLQEPLRMVANYTELLADRYRGQLDEKADMYIHYASDGARRMQRLIADLLAYSRLGSVPSAFAPVSIESVVERARRTFAEQIEASGATVQHEALPTVLADADQIELVFQNLIGNALKFRSDAPPRITVSAQRAGPEWRFTVSDNGLGMKMEDASRIFQMFQRLQGRERHEGSGIGLAIVKRIVERHDGRIWVESAPGEGSRFHFTLPALPDPA